MPNFRIIYFFPLSCWLLMLTWTGWATSVHAADPLRVAGGQPSGAYTAFIKDLGAKLASEGFAITPVISNGSRENLLLIQEGKADLALVQNDTAYYAWEGMRDHPLNQSFRIVIPLFPEYLQIAVRKDANINTLAGLRGKRINVGQPGSGSYRNALDLLNSLGLSSIEYVASHHPPAQALKLISKGQLDAAIFTSASPPLGDVNQWPKIQLLPLPKDVVGRLSAQFLYYSPATYKFGDKEVATISLTAYLIASNRVPKNKIKRLTQLLLKHWSELANGEGSYHLLSQTQIQAALARAPAPVDEAVAKILEKAKLMEPGSSKTILYGIFGIFFAVWYEVRRRRARYDRLGVVNVIHGRISYWFMVAFEYFFVIIVAVFLLLVALILVIQGIQYYEALYAREHAQPNPFALVTLSQALLWMWDWIGGHEGDIYPQSNMGRLMAGLPPLLGLGALLGTLVSWWRLYTRKQIQLQRGTVVEPVSDHVLICGWNEKVPGIIYGLTGDDAPEQKKVVIIAELEGDIPLAQYQFPPKKVQYYHGDSANRKALEAAYAKDAQAAIVVAGQKKRAQRNIGSVLTALAISAIRKQHDGLHPFICAELLFEKNRELFNGCGVDALVQSETVVEHLFAQACFNPNTLDLFMDLLTHDEHCEMYSVAVSELRKPPSWRHIWKNVCHKRYKLALALIKRRFTYSSLPLSTTKELWQSLLATGVTPVAVRRGNVREDAELNCCFNKVAYLFPDDHGDDVLNEEDMVLYIAAEQDDVFRPNLPPSPLPKDHHPLPWQPPTKTYPLRVTLIGDVKRCLKVKHQLNHLPGVEITLITTNAQTVKTNHIFHVDDLLEPAALEACVKSNPQVLAILIDNSFLKHKVAKTEAEMTEANAQTLLIARIYRNYLEEKGIHHCRIVGEMLGYANAKLFHDAGVDIAVPSTLITERLLIKMVYGFGHVSDYLMASLTLDDGVYLDAHYLTEEDQPWLDKTFEELLLAMPPGMQLLSIFPENQVLQKRLANQVGDFEYHFIGSPTHARELAYQSRPGDCLMVLRRNCKLPEEMMEKSMNG